MDRGVMPLSDLKHEEQLVDWLGKRPREVALSIAARASLRALPLAATAIGAAGIDIGVREYLGKVFRANARARALAAYPREPTSLVKGVTLSVGSKTLSLKQRPTVGGLAHQSFSHGRSKKIRVEKFKPRVPKEILAAMDVLTVAEAASHILTSSDFAQTAGRVVADSTAAFRRISSSESAWSSVAADCGYIGTGYEAQILRRAQELAKNGRLWLDGGNSTRIYWEKLCSFLPLDDDWDVWTRWYEARLSGNAWADEHEILFCNIPQDIVKRGAGAANRWIKLSLPKEELSGVFSEFPEPVPNAPSIFTFGWSLGQLKVASGPHNFSVFPYPNSEQDHADCLEACRQLAERLLRALTAGEYNVRQDYRQSLERYREDLPTSRGSGNLMLADQEARILREMFAAEADILPTGFASRLKGFLQQHTGLRVYYPEIARFYEAVQNGRLEKPLPEDAIDAVGRIVAENTPSVFAPEVYIGLSEIQHTAPTVELPKEDIRPTQGKIRPPPDPLGELPPSKAEAASKMGTINALWEALLKGKDLPEAVEGWEKIAVQMAPYVSPILRALKDFVTGGG